jgi:hypothetical protein
MSKYTNEQLEFINYTGDESIILSATAGSGKEQPLFCKILTPSGWTTMGEIKVGDEVLTPTGEVSKVTNIYPQGFKEAYKITFSDGSFTYAGKEHLWKVQTTYQRGRGSDNFKIVKTEDMIGNLFRANSKGVKRKLWYIPLTDIKYPEKELPIDPYLLGCLLGDGGLSIPTQISFSNSDPEIVNEINKLVDCFGLKLNPILSRPNNYTITSGSEANNPLLIKLRELGLMEHLSVEKFIPREYFTASKYQRFRLLNGLLDTDGYPEKNSIYITLSSKRLVDDITELINSIGGVVYTSLKRGRYKKNGVYIECNQAYVMSICLPKEMKFNAFTLPRKKNILLDKGKTYVPYRAVDTIEYYDTIECQCIEIDHPDHLYVTDNHIVTHNTHSTVGRLNKMIEDGVDPSRIIFFSFTNDAVNELKTRIKHDVKITTIHSFTSSILGKMGLFKPIVTFYDFINWYKEKYKPNPKDPIKIKMAYAKNVDKFYEEGNYISSTFSAYKLQQSDNIRVIKPQFYDEYSAFIKETKSRDFSDMLIDTERFSRNPKYKHYFDNLYDYIFVDEYQDTSTLQMKILLTMKGKQYHLIGDRNQSIYGFSGANCGEIEKLLESNKTVKRMTLTKNFRSHKNIVLHSNKYSDLVAVPHHENEGYIHENLINDITLYQMMQDGKPLTVLVRTNYVIKAIEKECLIKKIPMRYFNYITEQDIENIKNGKITTPIKKKIDPIIPYYGNAMNLIKFIGDNKNSDVFVTSIHKSKGREFPRCVIVNSVDPEMLMDSEYDFTDYSFVNDDGQIDLEARNIHYVAVTRPKEELYFLVMEN